MNCEILISEKLGGIPLAECGGMVLQPGDALVVSAAKGAELRKHYAGLFIVAGFEVRESLKNGSYEYSKGKSQSIYKSQSAVVHAAKHDNEEPSGYIASDKSMQGKKKAHRKG